jgi:hypothetical protein
MREPKACGSERARDRQAAFIATLAHPLTQERAGAACLRDAHQITSKANTLCPDYQHYNNIAWRSAHTAANVLINITPHAENANSHITPL